MVSGTSIIGRLGVSFPVTVVMETVGNRSSFSGSVDPSYARCCDRETSSRNEPYRNKYGWWDGNSTEISTRDIHGEDPGGGTIFRNEKHMTETTDSHHLEALLIA